MFELFISILLISFTPHFNQFVNCREILYPKKVTSDGTFISYNLNHEVQIDHKRVSRSINTVHQNYPIHYSLDTNSYGKLIIELIPNHKLLGPGFVFEKWSKLYSNENDITSNTIKKNTKFCFFNGHILNQNDSLVSISTCNGLKGFIKVSQEQLIIEPIRDHSNSSLPHPHVLIKRSVNDFGLGTIKHRGACGSSDDVRPSYRKREKWERKHKRHFKRRHKRFSSVSVERNVETLVVADRKTVEYYTNNLPNENLEMYILTIMNVVNTLYHDASIGNAINVVIVRVILFDEELIDNEFFASNQSSNITLRNFCRWQKHVNPKNETHPNHHDAAVLITRENICSNDETCNTLGLAEIAGMCQPQRSCAVVEDTGLSIAYTIAHEIGHNFGMSHDTLQNGCLLPLRGKQHIMSPDINTEAKSDIWSNCSRVQITKFLDRDWGRCLDDEPSDHEDFTYPQLPPGTMYDADHQCKFQFGQNASFCSEMSNLCEALWCRLDGQCITKLRPAAEGTICDNNKWCFLGKCVDIGERPGAINGEWGQWSPWSECTKSCGAGISHSERECNNPMPEYGGRYCIGDRKRYKVCNTQDCPPNTPSFRAEQCSSFDKHPYKNQYYKWLPVLSPINPCQLYCKPEKKSFSVMLSDTVIDGTFCHPGTRDMCINGKCRSVACDWIIDSKAQEDRCGVCHGDGTQCLTIKGTFNQTKGFGYEKIVLIPEGARNIRVEELFDDGNYLALFDRNNDYVLNGDFLIDWSGEFSGFGTTFYYDRTENGLEKLHAPGPTKEKVQVMLLFQSENRGIKWEYTVSDLNTSRKPEFSWQFSEFDSCSRSCGGGTQISRVRCIEKEAGLVEDTFCSLISKPSDKIRSCNKHICPARWWTGPWHNCNATCISSGIKRRSVLCVRSLGADEQIALLENECNDLNKPMEFESCKHSNPCSVNEISFNKTESENNFKIKNQNKCTAESESKLFCKTAMNLCNTNYVRSRCCFTCKQFDKISSKSFM